MPDATPIHAAQKIETVEVPQRLLRSDAGLKPRLLDQARDAIRTRHYSYRTEEAYVGWIRRFILFHNKRHPGDMGPPEITQFLTALAVDRHVSASTQNQALAAVRFLYQQVLGCDPGWLDGIVRAKQAERLPVVLTRAEVQALLAALDGLAWIMALLLYGAGLRLIECLRLRVKDIEFSRNEIVVREGKGNKDRVTMLPAAVEGPLQAHLQQVRDVHTGDLRAGYGRVQLPDALAAKYPNAAASGDGSGCFRLHVSVETHAVVSRSAFTHTSPCCRRRSTGRHETRALVSRSVRTRSDIALRHICWKLATTFARCRSSSVTAM